MKSISAKSHASHYSKQEFRVSAEDLSDDKNTSDKIVFYRNNGNIYAVDGLYTALGFGGKNKKTGQRILKSRDTMQGFYTTGDYATRRTYRGKDKKIAGDNSLLTANQRYTALTKRKITEDNHWIAIDKQPSKYNAFKKLVSQNIESIRVGSSKIIGPTSQIDSRFWNGILVQAARQLDPCGVRIQEYRTENHATQAQLTDIDIVKRIINTKKRGKKLDSVAFQIIQGLQEQRSAFKIRADFGTIIETSEYDGNEQKISYKYILPVDANTERRVPLIIKSQENIQSYKHYMRDVIADTQERTQEDTLEQQSHRYRNISNEERFIMQIVR
ncbi:MAG: hypothetical protein EZS28_033335 [Streblomastix strix]|uniref:Uncharacterized protein n=1 Tax=Streblomastix strix TaxID=222440 RepID=A0A5J4UKZ3_9EUKA|nr:MAG: hypothetical protein EZS28_033335 [Streblomastix strix]